MVSVSLPIFVRSHHDHADRKRMGRGVSLADFQLLPLSYGLGKAGQPETEERSAGTRPRTAGRPGNAFACEGRSRP